MDAPPAVAEGVRWKAAWLLVAVVAAGAAAAAQEPEPRPRLRPPLPPTEEEELRQYDPLAPVRQRPWASPYRRGFQGFESVYPDYAYPSYPEGYGPPRRLDRPEPDELLTPFVSPVVPEPPETGWPSWMLSEGAPGRQPTPSVAMLARMADRVWVLAPDDNAFVPLSFWDKFEPVVAGTRVEVRNKGEFQLAFSAGGWLRSLGPVELAVQRLDPEAVALDFDSYRRVWLTARERPFRVGLPDGSHVDVRNGEVYLERRAGIGTVMSHGAEPVLWTGRTGRVELEAGMRLKLLLAPAATPFLGADLELEGDVRVERDGRVLVVRGVGGGAVVWSGARFVVPPGAAVRLDPLAGTEFPEAAER